jgi:pimeloyl-ACP methyl ester carboxylesterase
MVVEALRAGPWGAQLDAALLAGPWDFDPRAIRLPVHLWHGELDRNVAAASARRLAAAIPGSRATFYPDEAHFSLVVNRAAEILPVLAAR